MPTSSLAKQIVNRCLNVTEKDNVSILMYPHTMKLAEEISVECFKKGADVLLNLYTDE
jgi:leucyl aminopeptidase (aminopeptidase T)